MSDLDQHQKKSAADLSQAAASSEKPVKSAAARLPVPASNDPLSKFRNKNAQPDDDARMGFIDHLMELRKRLWISIIAVFICVAVAIVFYKPIYNFLAQPVRDVNKRYMRPYAEKEFRRQLAEWKSSILELESEVLKDARRKDDFERRLKAIEVEHAGNLEMAFMLEQDVCKEELTSLKADVAAVGDVKQKQLFEFKMKKLEVTEPRYIEKDIINLSTTQPLGTMIMVIWLGFWGGIVVASPILLYELWAFVAPGLRDKEKRAIMPVLYGGILFFMGGTAIAYYFLSPVTFDFFAWLDLDVGVTIIWTSETCIEMLLTMMIISGLLCEIPLLIAGMAYLDVISPSTLLRHWRGFTFGSIALGAIVSPGNDLASMAAFSGLVLGIYLVSIVMAFIFHRKTPVPGKP